MLKTKQPISLSYKEVITFSIVTLSMVFKCFHNFFQKSLVLPSAPAFQSQPCQAVHQVYVSNIYTNSAMLVSIQELMLLFIHTVSEPQVVYVTKTITRNVTLTITPTPCSANTGVLLFEN